MSTVTIRMLASALNLSPGTVSKALKDSYEISAETKQKVMDMAAKLDYVPNPYAGGLRRRKSQTIGVVLPAISDSFFSLAIEGIEEVAHEKGYHVLICLSHERYTEETKILKDFGSGRVDGVLMSVASETGESSHICHLLEKKVPVVLFDRVCPEVNTALVSTDDQQAGYAAASHLVQKGCRRILYLSISDSLSISQERGKGVERALRESGVAGTSLLCTGSTEQMSRTLQKVLSRGDRPDGVVASVEKLVTPVYLACHGLGLAIPEDVKVICFSNMPQAALLSPALTTITQPAFEIGKTAASLLVTAMGKPGFDLSKASVVLPSELQIRAST